MSRIRSLLARLTRRRVVTPSDPRLRAEVARANEEARRTAFDQQRMAAEQNQRAMLGNTMGLGNGM